MKFLLKESSFHFLVLISQASVAQNLVPNSSFEDTIACPNSYSQITLTKFWIQPTTGTCDYFNKCDQANFVSVPINFIGYENAKTGNAYAGCYVYDIFDNYHEYIQIALTKPLLIGKKYCVEYYLSLADSAEFAIAEIGAYFSNSQVSSTNFYNLSYTPQVTSPSGSFISGKQGWTRVAGEFISKGGEKYLTIGNFKDSLSTKSIFTNGGGAEGVGASYYYIDDVSVYQCDDTVLIETPNIFSPNGDGVNDIFKIRNSALADLDCKIYDRWGIIIGEWRGINGGWDGRTISGSEAPPSVYYYSMIGKDESGKEYNKTGFVHLIR